MRVFISLVLLLNVTVWSHTAHNQNHLPGGAGGGDGETSSAPHQVAQESSEAPLLAPASDTGAAAQKDDVVACTVPADVAPVDQARRLAHLIQLLHV